MSVGSRSIASCSTTTMCDLTWASADGRRGSVSSSSSRPDGVTNVVEDNS